MLGRRLRSLWSAGDRRWREAHASLRELDAMLATALPMAAANACARPASRPCWRDPGRRRRCFPRAGALSSSPTGPTCRARQAPERSSSSTMPAARCSRAARRARARRRAREAPGGVPRRRGRGLLLPVPGRPARRALARRRLAIDQPLDDGRGRRAAGRRPTPRAVSPSTDARPGARSSTCACTARRAMLAALRRRRRPARRSCSPSARAFGRADRAVVRDARQPHRLDALAATSLGSGSRELHDSRRELEHRAFHDPLTGLANRLLFMDRSRHALSRRQGNARSSTSTSTTSSRSTTRSATTPATPSSEVAARLDPTLRGGIRRPGSAATSSPCSCSTSRTSSPRIIAERLLRARRAVRRSAAARSRSAPASASRWHPAAPWPATSCCATPTPRCTSPSTAASAAYHGLRPDDADGTQRRRAAAGLSAARPASVPVSFGGSGSTASRPIRPYVRPTDTPTRHAAARPPRCCARWRRRRRRAPTRASSPSQTRLRRCSPPRGGAPSARSVPASSCPGTSPTVRATGAAPHGSMPLRSPASCRS